MFERCTPIEENAFFVGTTKYLLLRVMLTLKKIMFSYNMGGVMPDWVF